MGNIATDAVAAADNVGGRGGDRGGPLDLAMVKMKMCSSEAIQQCADAVEVFRSSSWACGGANTHNIATNPMAKKPSPGDGTTSTSGISRKGGTRHPEEELKSFRFRLEAETIQLAVASFGTEVRQLAISPSAPAHSMVTEATIIGQEPPPPALTPSSSLSSLPSDYFSQRDPTRSWLDLRRAARVRAFAQALGEMMSPGREALLDDDLMVSLTDCNVYRHSRRPSWILHKSIPEVQDRIERTGGKYFLFFYGVMARHYSVRNVASLPTAAVRLRPLFDLS